MRRFIPALRTPEGGPERWTNTRYRKAAINRRTPRFAETIMLEVRGPSYRCCDGVSRRGFLKVGFLGLAGLTLADHLRLKAAAAAAGRPSKDTAVILFWLGGGPSHLDMYDLKPDTPAEFRG